MKTEKILLQDSTVLMVCISARWTTIERRTIEDAIYLRNIGSSPVLLCKEGSQLDKIAEQEDIQRIYVQENKLPFKVNFDLTLYLRKIIKDNHYDIIHCYNIKSLWISALLLKSNAKVSLFFTLNQRLRNVYHSFYYKWLLKRVDQVFTLSEESRDLVYESFYISPLKVKNLGAGLDLVKKERSFSEPKKIGCIINNINELKKLHHIIRIFRVLKMSGEKFQDVSLSIFLGPRIYQKNAAKKVLTELDYEFYEGDILLYSLEAKSSEVKDLDIFVGISHDEILNDYEITSLIYGIPVLFPRTAARQTLLFKYNFIGESYLIGDVREAKNKLEKMINDYKMYFNALQDYSIQILDSNGLEDYSNRFYECYQSNLMKRQRLLKNRTKMKS